MDAPPAASNGLAAAASHAASSALSSSSAAAAAAPASRLHLISDEQQFTPSLAESLQQWHLLDAGFAYNLCAVLGSQSTGKSTLLNRLFGTSFDVMDERVRGQTTKGASSLSLSFCCRGEKRVRRGTRERLYWR